MKALHNLAAAGHDSELYSFILDEQRAALETHPAARLKLWTLGSTTGGTLRRVCQWNGIGSVVSTEPLKKQKSEGSSVFREIGFIVLGCGDDAIQVETLALVRQLLLQGHGACWAELVFDPHRDGPVLLHRGQWVAAADRNGARMRHIRRFMRPERNRSPLATPGRYSTSDREFVELRDSLVDWAIRALDAALARSQRTEAAA
ncbi:MAG: hypothetical protein VX930_00125 [Pseudomonadota bacterium]|nr:hypothetical protein [Pseudomonadota bacterium]